MKRLPGTETGPFHYVLLGLNAVQRIPSLFFGLLLVAIAAQAGFFLRLLNVPAPLDRFCALSLLVAFAADWILLAALPRAGRSFGPVQPPLILLALMRTLVGVALGLTPLLGVPPAWVAALVFVAQLVGVGLAFYAFRIEPHSLTLTRHSIPAPMASEATRPLRILHLADLHVERITDRERDVLRRVKELAPDAILFSGDFLNLSYVHDPIAHAEVREFLSSIQAPLGVYAVTGSPPVDVPEVVTKLLDGLHWRWLKNERVTLERDGAAVDVIGLTCTHDPQKDGPTLARLLDGKPRDGTGRACPCPFTFTILLYHTPDLAPEAAKLGIDLQLSGHTHGGQVRLPFYGAFFAGSLYGKRFECGLYQVGKMRLFVSRGIGMEGMGAPRVRFLCPPEIAVFEIGGDFNAKTPGRPGAKELISLCVLCALAPLR